MIELGLARIGRIAPKAYPWRAIHIAGTNGKGSISAYLSAMIKEAGFRPARYNSPHLIDRWDCITIDDKTVDKTSFETTEDAVKRKDRELQIKASEFEVLTATALEIFNASYPRIDYGVIEVGMGGRLDATNILPNVEISIIAKIGLDHQAFLGRTIEQIAREKAGIMRPDVPCLVDGTNQPEVIQTLEAHAEEVGTPLSLITLESRPQSALQLQAFCEKQDLEPHQRTNLLVAVEAMKLLIARRTDRDTAQPKSYLQGLKNVEWPGRLQSLGMRSLTGRDEPLLLDGAHNRQSAEVLAQHVTRKVRKDGKPVTWIIAASQGKDITGMLDCLLQDGDRVVPVSFGPVDGMPWVKSASLDSIGAAAGASTADVQVVDIHDADMDSLIARVRLASDIAQEDPIVIAGSLYLVSDVLRLLRDNE